MSLQFRIWTLTIVGTLFVLGLLVLLFWGGDQGIVPVVACIGLISYCFYSANELRKKLPPG